MDGYVIVSFAVGTLVAELAQADNVIIPIAMHERKNFFIPTPPSSRPTITATPNSMWADAHGDIKIRLDGASTKV